MTGLAFESLISLYVGIGVVGVILLFVIFYLWCKKKNYTALVVIVYILIAILIGLLGFMLVLDDNSSSTRYDIGLILIDNFISSIVFGFILFVIRELNVNNIDLSKKIKSNDDKKVVVEDNENTN